MYLQFFSTLSKFRCVARLRHELKFRGVMSSCAWVSGWDLKDFEIIFFQVEGWILWSFFVFCPLPFGTLAVFWNIIDEKKVSNIVSVSRSLRESITTC